MVAFQIRLFSLVWLLDGVPQEIEDLETEVQIHPFFDTFWESKRAQLHKITCPAYVIASWQDQGLHIRGTLEGWKKIHSKEKWLECHGRKVRPAPPFPQSISPTKSHPLPDAFKSITA